ncbi:unnamed protein product [Cuscuta campestris]|uniref:Uncharacterized protein n=1 Tax=Cuscuta campestris TaxID=132261 RepID=A0A484LD86_9ASTE|nr:unnamed protein product [Cuscuta campestris]
MMMIGSFQLSIALLKSLAGVFSYLQFMRSHALVMKFHEEWVVPVNIIDDTHKELRFTSHSLGTVSTRRVLSNPLSELDGLMGLQRQTEFIEKNWPSLTKKGVPYHQHPTST